MTKNIFGTLGILGLFVAIGIGLIAAFGGFAQKSLITFVGNAPRGTEPSGKATTKNVSQLEQSATGVGKSVNAGDLSWTVTDAHEESKITKEGPNINTRYGNFVIVKFTVKNNADYPLTLTPEVINLFANDGQMYPPRSNVNGGYVEDVKNILFNQESLLQPGATKEGQANFELPHALSPSLLEVGNPNSGSKEYVDLGL